MDLIVVYLWQVSKNLPHGHSAMKIEKNGVARYYSWWPSKDGRATPPTYGKTAASTDKLPSKDAPNYDRQLQDRQIQKLSNAPGERQERPLKSDKDMLSSDDTGKHATYKFYFRAGLDVGAAEQEWESTLASNINYAPNYTCHIPVAEALIAAFGNRIERNGSGHVSDKNFKKLVRKNGSGVLVPDGVNNWSVTRTAKLCHNIGKALDTGGLRNDSAVIVRHNNYDSATKTLTKSDYAPSNVEFSADNQARVVLTPTGSPQKVNPRMSDTHHKDEAKADAELFESDAKADA